MIPGSILEIRLTGGAGTDVAIEHIEVDVRFFCGGRERYRFTAGTTDVHGRIAASYDHFENIRLENQRYALMDYNTKLEDCDSEVVISVPTGAELEQRVEALQQWYPDRAKEVQERLQNSRNGTVRATDVKVSLSSSGATSATIACEKL